MTPPLPFSPATLAWLASAFTAPTPAQEQAWAAIARGEDTLVVAPTGSGKTLAAFLWALDGLISPRPVAAPPGDMTAVAREPGDTGSGGCHVLYISPLRALAVDVDRNLRSPLIGITHAAARLAQPIRSVTIAVRTGDTPASERTRFAREPSDILITTPESLFLLLTSQAREVLRTVSTVIVDEVHALAGSKRGAHLAVSLERLDHLCGRSAQRIGLSATVNPPGEVARFLRATSPVTVVAPASDKQWDIRVEVPSIEMAAVEYARESPDPDGEVTGSAAGGVDRPTIWPSVEQRLLDLISDQRCTLVFANSRRLSERLTAHMNTAAAERAGRTADPTSEPLPDQRPATELTPVVHPIARAHHGSVSREQREQIEEELKAGRLPAVVATSSLELGIDMGAVDLVVQVAPPPSVASGVQRVGRAGHQVGAISQGVIMATHRGDLPACAVVAERMRAGLVERMRIPSTPLDVLAQQVVAMVAMEPWPVAELAALIRRSAPFTGLTDALLAGVLDMLAGRYPSDEFAELRPRLLWDRVSGELRGRPGAQRLAVTSGGTIPDRGLFTVVLGGERSSRVGELDEEMVYELRVGEVIALGASSWRVEQITPDRVIVSPAPGQPGRTPFWRGDAPGRPAELGHAIGGLLRTSTTAGHREFTARLVDAGFDDRSCATLIDYLAEQRQATGRLPDDRTIVVESVRDEIGDWRVIIHSPFGASVHAPWALLIAARLHQDLGAEIQVVHADDGIVVRLPESDADNPAARVIEALIVDPSDVASGVRDAVGGSALFASRFREAAGRALLLPRRNPGRRAPLWQQRQRAAHLLKVAVNYPDFPIVLETVRECLTDVYDVPALTELLQRIATGEVSVVDVATSTPSPFARSLLLGYVGTFIYDGDAPLAERRAHALTLDSGLLADLLGTPELRALLDADAIDEVAAEVGHLTEATRARSLEDAADLLRILGPMTTARAAGSGISTEWLAALCDQRRAIPVRIAGEWCTAAIEDAGRLRDALGIALPPGLPAQFTAPVVDPLVDVIARFSRTHGPFTSRSCADRLGLPVGAVAVILQSLVAKGRIVAGQFRPGEVGEEWCDPGVLRRIRRRSIARLREQSEPVSVSRFAHAVQAWQQVATGGQPPARSGEAALLSVIDSLAGVSLPAPVWERAVFPARIRNYHPAMLDALLAAGEVVWWGTGRTGRAGIVTLAPADLAAGLIPEPGPFAVGADAGADVGAHRGAEGVGRALLALLQDGGGYFFREILHRLTADGSTPAMDGSTPAMAGYSPGVVADVLWSLVWQGRLTNDGWAALRAVHAAGSRAATARPVLARRLRPRPRFTAGLPPSGVAGATSAMPPSLAGRWSALRPTAIASEERALIRAEVLLGRWGIVSRALVSAESVPGGFAALYPVLAALEHTGAVQRTYAIEGLGAAQFALPSAVDRLREEAARMMPVRGPWTVLAALDPAVLHGSVIPWPPLPQQVTGRPQRVAGAWVVLAGGELLAYLARGGEALLVWPQPDSPATGQPSTEHVARVLRVLASDRLLWPVGRGSAQGGAGESWAGESRSRTRLSLNRINGEPIGTQGPLPDALRLADYLPTPSGWRPRAVAGRRTAESVQVGNAGLAGNDPGGAMVGEVRAGGSGA